MTDGKIPCALDAAFARNSEPFTGILRVSPGDPVPDDDVPSAITAWALEGCPVGVPVSEGGGWQATGEVALQPDGTAVRVLLRPAAARALAAQLEAAADEIDPDHQDETREVTT
jgi:hypothetical protein